MSLNDRHIRFCELYLQTGNAKRSYVEAGFEAKTERAIEAGASKLLKKPEIQKYLHDRRQPLRDATDSTMHTIVQNLNRIASANINDFITWKDGQTTLIDSDKLTLEQTYAIRRLKGRRRPIMNAEGDVVAEDVDFDLELHSKETALKLLASYYGIDNDMNAAIAALTRYGLYLKRDETQPSGWRVDLEV